MSQPSLGSVCFRKAASATWPSQTPTQVGDPTRPGPSLWDSTEGNGQKDGRAQASGI